MKDCTKDGKMLMRNIRKILINYQQNNKLTNLQMSMKCEISLSEYERIMNVNRHGVRGCYAMTIYKIHENLHIDYDAIYDI